MRKRKKIKEMRKTRNTIIRNPSNTLYHVLTSVFEENTVARSKHPCICIDVWIRILLEFSSFLYYTLEYEDDPQATEVYEQDQDPATFEPV